MKKLNKKGFTIVELVIVIAVIAILAGVLIPTFATVVEKANKNSAQQQARNFYTLLEAATAAPTTYTMTTTENNSTTTTTYTVSMQKGGLVISKTGANKAANANDMLVALLGDDVKTYNGANVGTDDSVIFNTGATWTISTIYFQPKDSAYFAKIDLVGGTVGEAVKIDTTNNKMPTPNIVTLNTSAN